MLLNEVECEQQIVTLQKNLVDPLYIGSLLTPSSETLIEHIADSP